MICSLITTGTVIMEDFDPEEFTYKPPQYDYEAHHPEETFERSCIRTLNRIWIPNLSFSKLEQIFKSSDSGDVLNYYWYSQHISFSNLSVPELTFSKLKTAWQNDLHKLLKQDIKKSDIYKSWTEQPSDGFVFPLIGSQAIMFKSCVPPEFNCVVNKQKDNFIVIALLQDYAKLFKKGEFYV